ncbi:hypothetical protein ACOSQ2_013108 [Xanthoceras sorbifolium]
MVSSLKGASGDWNAKLVRASFSSDEADAILPIPSYIRQDSLCWHFDKFGRFSVTSEYWLASQDPSQASSSTQSPLSF